MLVGGGVTVAVLSVSHPKPTSNPATHAPGTLIQTKSPSPKLAGGDCGKFTFGTTSTHVFNECFNQHFAACQPARTTVDNETPTLKGVVINYRIDGKQGASCLVTWSYQKLSQSPAWEKKVLRSSDKL